MKDFEIDIDDEQYLQSLSYDELKTIRQNVDFELDDLESIEGMFAIEAKLPSKVPSLATKHFRNVDSLASQLENGKISLSTFNNKMREQISDKFTEAYSLGKGVSIGDLTDGDLAHLDRAIKTEMEFAKKFGQDIKTNKLKMPRQKRSAMYGRSIDGMAWNGQVESQPADVRVRWELGIAEHCPDCTILAANSPYTKRSLPTVPRGGDTQCRANCQCRLVYYTGKISRAEKVELQGQEKRSRGSLEQIIKPTPPKGVRRPTNAQQIIIGKLRNKINFNRRKMAQANSPSEKEKYSLRRKKANDELEDYLNKRNLYDVPAWSVDEVISGLDLGPRAHRDLLRFGLDGASLGLMDKARLEALFKRYKQKIGSTEALKEAKQEKKDFVAIPFKPRGKMGDVAYNLVGETLKDTMLLFGELMMKLVGTEMILAPFDDLILAKTGIWLEGPEEQIKEFIE